MIEEQKISREIKGTIPKVDREYFSSSVMAPMLNEESSNFLPGLQAIKPRDLEINHMVNIDSSSHSNNVSYR